MAPARPVFSGSRYLYRLIPRALPRPGHRSQGPGTDRSARLPTLSLCWGPASSRPGCEPGPVSTFLPLWKFGCWWDRKYRKRAGVRVRTQDPPAQTCQKPPVSTAVMAPSTAATPVPGKHHAVHAWDAAATTHHAKRGWGGSGERPGERTQRVLPPCNPLLLCCLRCRSVCQPFRCH